MSPPALFTAQYTEAYTCSDAARQRRMLVANTPTSHTAWSYLRGSRPHIQVPILERWQHHLHDFVHVEARSSARRHTVDLEAKLIDEGFQQAQS